jgi:predicted metal-dependent TIM-barrel fold hydrolase
MHTLPRKKATKNQKKNHPLLQISVESCLIAIDHCKDKIIKDMMNMSFRVGGLRFKTKTKKEATTVVVAQYICEQFLSSFFLSCSTVNMVVL